MQEVQTNKQINKNKTKTTKQPTDNNKKQNQTEAIILCCTREIQHLSSAQFSPLHANSNIAAAAPVSWKRKTKTYKIRIYFLLIGKAYTMI